MCTPVHLPTVPATALRRHPCLPRTAHSHARFSFGNESRPDVDPYVQEAVAFAFEVGRLGEDRGRDVVGPVLDHRRHLDVRVGLIVGGWSVKVRKTARRSPHVAVLERTDAAKLTDHRVCEGATARAPEARASWSTGALVLKTGTRRHGGCVVL